MDRGQPGPPVQPGADVVRQIPGGLLGRDEVAAVPVAVPAGRTLLSRLEQLLHAPELLSDGASDALGTDVGEGGDAVVPRVAGGESHEYHRQGQGRLRRPHGVELLGSPLVAEFELEFVQGIVAAPETGSDGSVFTALGTAAGATLETVWNVTLYINSPNPTALCPFSAKQSYQCGDAFVLEICAM